MAHKAAGIKNVLNPDVDGCKRIWWWLTMETDQAWKDTNDVLFSHQLKYYTKLTKFITEIERILQGKCTEIWDCVTCITEAAHLSPEAGLCLTLHYVESLPTIPVDLRFCSMISMLLAYCPESYSLQTWDPMGDRDYLLDANAQVSGVLLRKLACIQGSAPVDSYSPCHVLSPAGSTGSLGSRASLPPGGHISCTHSETPMQTRNQSSSSFSCSCHSDSGIDGHESEGSGGPPGSQSDGEQDGEANKSVSDHSGGEESDGNAEEQDESGQQDNAQETDEFSSDETSSETKSSEVPVSEAAKSAIIELDSEDSESSSDSNSRETMPLVPMPKKEGKEAKPSTAQSSLLLFLDPKLPEEQQKIEQCNHACSLDVDFGKW